MSSDITPEEIKRIRQSYKLSQQAFARVLGIGEASIVRYENGQVPSRANANLIRAARNKEFMLDCLDRAGESISAQQRKNTEEIIYAEIRFNEKGEVMGMNEIYALNLQKEILNEQAAEILGDLFRMKLEAERLGNEVLAAVCEDISMQIAMAKHKITSREYSTEAKIAELRGQILGLMKFAKVEEAKAA